MLTTNNPTVTRENCGILPPKKMCTCQFQPIICSSHHLRPPLEGTHTNSVDKRRKQQMLPVTFHTFTFLPFSRAAGLEIVADTGNETADSVSYVIFRE